VALFSGEQHAFDAGVSVRVDGTPLGPHVPAEPPAQHREAAAIERDGARAGGRVPVDITTDQHERPVAVDGEGGARGSDVVGDPGVGDVRQPGVHVDRAALLMPDAVPQRDVDQAQLPAQHGDVPAARPAVAGELAPFREQQAAGLHLDGRIALPGAAVLIAQLPDGSAGDRDVVELDGRSPAVPARDLQQRIGAVPGQREAGEPQPGVQVVRFDRERARDPDHRALAPPPDDAHDPIPWADRSR
jgi:hypothetical protein